MEQYASVLDELLATGERIYSAAYIIPPPPFGAHRKHTNHLRLVRYMLADGVVGRLTEASSLTAVFEVLSSYPSLGPFLAYQLTIDLNYSTAVDYDENDFVVAGPGRTQRHRQVLPPRRRTVWQRDHRVDDPLRSRAVRRVGAGPAHLVRS